MDPALMALWVQIQDRVQQIAAREKKTVNENLELEDFIENVEQKEPRKRDKAKAIFGNTLTVIGKVGGMAADAASQVFAPAAQCYNVISFLIDAYEGYQGAFDGLGELFEECTDYLNRLHSYVKGKMDARLTKIAVQQMDLFVRVCDAALDLRYSYGEKIKTALKVMFLADDGIQPLLGQMAKLVNKERNLVAAETFLFSREAADAAKEALDATRRVEVAVSAIHAQGKDANRETTIKKALGLPGEPETPWRLRYRDYLRHRLRETGQWIFNEPAFSSWETGQSETNILAIEGGNGTGKSFLSSAIIHHFLHKKEATQTDRRVATAYYFFEGSERDELKDARNLETAAKSLVWQFTQAERQYMKSVARICAATQEIDPSSISSDLLFENADLLDMDVMFYIVIDGLSGKMGQGMQRFLKRASNVKAGQRVRVLLTVDPQCSRHLDTVDSISFNSISLSSKNRPDVERVIESRMDSMPTLRDKARPGISQLRARVCEELCRVTDGDYFRINLALDDISKRQYESAIVNALKKAGDGRIKQIRNEIERLNHNCSEAEISEINEIILWIRRYRENLTEKQMTEALRAAVGESSLLTLADKIRENYPVFKLTSKGEVVFRAPEVEDSIPDKRDLSSAREQGGPGAAVSPGETAMVKHFLSTVCPPETYLKLDLDNFLKDKRQDRRNRIYKDDPTFEEAKMALTCLRLLTGETEHSSAALVSYARSNLKQHLSAVNMALVDVECKRRFGPLLIKLFTNHKSIDIAMDNDDGGEAKQRLIAARLMLGDGFTALILRWFGDTAVGLDISDEDRNWITGLHDTDGHQELLTPIVTRMAIHLLQEPHFNPLLLSAFGFIKEFLQKFEPDYLTPFTSPVETVPAIEQWCEELLKVSKTSVWHTQIGSLLQLGKNNQAAEDRARRALQIDPNDWRASTLLACLVSPRDGITILKPAAEALESSSEWKLSSPHRMGLAKMLCILAELSWHEGHTDAAINFWNRAVEVDFTDYVREIFCLRFLASQERWPEIMKILGKIQEESTEQLQGLSELIALNGGKAFPHPIALQAALHTEQLEFLVSAYERAVELVEERGERNTECRLLYHCGQATHALQNGSSKANKHWRRALSSAGSVDKYLLSSLISIIAPYYARKADASGPDTESVSDYLKRIETLLPEGTPEGDVLVPPRLYIARYHWRKGNQVKAKQIARDSVKLSLDILSDGDEGNDLPAYSQLLSVFIAFGDMANLMATRALMELNFKGQQVLGCNGWCNRVWQYSEKTQWCQDCINASFEDECAQKIEQDALPAAVCDSTHQFLRAPRLDDSVELTPYRMVPFEGEEITFDDWLGRIEKEYVSFEN
ncbi:hypothetical protein ASPVEDRAFT_48104 [Aspergillus versicolor CBS 583.65]|uniref:Uncharacterized protein n=1 Tax=Aspergillus versicolor CBS 583.65 TaxID=1036611 RepID=A0A1L9P2W3_ASPVE|nr:uncharacterized protein ASPVEDRAFT_48104 [Aspergillus versicolor CBS 583.65]OJI95763.1 hypothetical protein ASPVEDRAFT_48104 [Aspergillus versicolor CBS 583.65]